MLLQFSLRETIRGRNRYRGANLLPKKSVIYAICWTIELRRMGGNGPWILLKSTTMRLLRSFLHLYDFYWLWFSSDFVLFRPSGLVRRDRWMFSFAFCFERSWFEEHVLFPFLFRRWSLMAPTAVDCGDFFWLSPFLKTTTWSRSFSSISSSGSLISDGARASIEQPKRNPPGHLCLLLGFLSFWNRQLVVANRWFLVVSRINRFGILGVFCRYFRSKKFFSCFCSSELFPVRKKRSHFLRLHGNCYSIEWWNFFLFLRRVHFLFSLCCF